MPGQAPTSPRACAPVRPCPQPTARCTLSRRTARYRTLPMHVTASRLPHAIARYHATLPRAGHVLKRFGSHATGDGRPRQRTVL
eukprot:2686037-Rhodomonas_salina.1